MSKRVSLLALLLAAGAALPAHADSFASAPEFVRPVDFVLLEKSARRLTLYRQGEEIRSYRVSLGLDPTGPKQREGDFRTPEGLYLLTRRNPGSEFFLSIQVSYPDAKDLALARRNGWSPGGAIMIHGLPNIPRYSREQYLTNDWTDGCIAVSNEDMLEIWLLTEPDTPIEIRP